jgi:two-component system, LuxR family, sensor kinase FixL
VASRTQQLTRANQRLLASEHDLTNFFDEAPLGLLWLAPDGRILRANQAQATLFGSSMAELTGRRLSEFCVDPEIVQAMVLALARKESVRDRPMRLIRPDGSSRHVFVDANGAWNNGSLMHSRWFVRDVSHQVELQKEILDVGERVRRQIGHDLHDDLCQQLTIIEYLVRALERQLGSGTKAAADSREIASLARRAIAYTRELSHTMSPMELASDGLPGALQVLAAQTKRLFHIDCRFKGDSSISIGDSLTQINLYRVAQEAIKNAIKHGRAGRIQISLMAKRGFVNLSVQDDGVGLTLHRYKKRGLGLHIMNYRASALGGSLLVQRRKSGGTILVCSIPRDSPRQHKNASYDSEKVSGQY